MVKVIYNTNSLKMKGHADYAEYGKDIVCAAISALVTCTVNNLYSLSNKPVDYYDDGKSLEIKINNDDEISSKLLNNLIEMLKQLEESYPKNIKIEREK